MGTGIFNAGATPAMDWHTIQGGVEILLVASSYGNRDKLPPDGPVGSNADFTKRTDTRPIPDRYLADTWPILDRYLADTSTTVDRYISTDISTDGLSKYRSTIGRLSTDSRPIVGRWSTHIATDSRSIVDR